MADMVEWKEGALAVGRAVCIAVKTRRDTGSISCNALAAGSRKEVQLLFEDLMSVLLVVGERSLVFLNMAPSLQGVIEVQRR